MPAIMLIIILPEFHLMVALECAPSPAQHTPTGRCAEEPHPALELASLPRSLVLQFAQFDSLDAH